MTEQPRVALEDAVEAIARMDDRRRLSRSPFHLSACGGCGAPAFQQPCSLCGHYPMGEREPTVSTPASKEAFVRMIEASGPGRRDGTIATWHARDHYETAAWGNRADRGTASEQAAEEASHLDVPDASTVWAVIRETGTVTRPHLPRHVAQGWDGLSEIHMVASGGYRTEPVRESAATKALIVEWIEAVEAQDDEGMRRILREGVQVAAHVNDATRRSHTGNVKAAVAALSDALDSVPDAEARQALARPRPAGP